MLPETHLVLHHVHAAELRARAEAHRLAAEAGHPSDLRARLGWTLVEVGLRLVAPAKPVAV
ncbi:hypothetical protein [Streptomyces carpinensis]|uniref:Uncharacterized protein n=1 Tax=Streptomyces carpinensis TaxID=66369 RepID=A0ABV1W9K0_9ACTN|nr:hypothetical protein [Streptomyces carpinensis]